MEGGKEKERHVVEEEPTTGDVDDLVEDACSVSRSNRHSSSEQHQNKFCHCFRTIFRGGGGDGNNSSSINSATVNNASRTSNYNEES